MINDRRWETGEAVIPADTPHWAWRLYAWVTTTYRPYLGWLVLFATLLLTWLPALALGENRVTELRRIQAGVDAVGPIAVLFTWLLLGWHNPHTQTQAQRSQFWIFFGGLGRFLLFLMMGLIVLSQALVDWLPGVRLLWQTVLRGSWITLFQGMATDWQQLLTRIVLWWQGVQGGGAAQDNLIFAAIAGVIFWLAGGVTALLIRRTKRGLVSTLPLLWLLGTMVLYTTTNRGLMLAGIAFAVILHLLLDQQQLMQRWQARGLDYSPDLVIDRMMVIGGIGVALFLTAAILPNFYYGPLVTRYYKVIQPLDEQLETVRGRLFPDLAGISRRGSAGAGGLPNAFLLGGGVDLGEEIVMQVRTDDSAGYDEQLYYMEEIQPPGHYMRGATLTRYDGYGWDNPPGLQSSQQNANTTWTTPPDTGRRRLVQTVTLFVNSPILYAAPEPLEPGIEYEAQFRADGDLVALRQRVRNYTIVSSIPAVSVSMLSGLAEWSAENPLPADYAIHLELPDTITDRTRELAAELVADQPTLYEKARAIEIFLRQYEYDLEVPAPPRDVADVADYFLFDLQRGYCDYYATAFIVLARLAGIPARFATGYAVGYWDPGLGAWTVTESQAHSWPEVYFPEYGWIPFEPTAGRPELARVGFGGAAISSTGGALPLPPTAEPTNTGFVWNWQMLFWLLPLGLALWGLVVLGLRYQQQREDPWAALQRWGRRVGRPIAEHETILEYGHGLADYVLQRQTQTQDVGRLVAREVTALSGEVNGLRYGTERGRAERATALRERWVRLRAYLRRLSMRVG